MLWGKNSKLLRNPSAQAQGLCLWTAEFMKVLLLSLVGCAGKLNSLLWLHRRAGNAGIDIEQEY